MNTFHKSSMPTISFSTCWEIQAALVQNQFGANARPMNFSRNRGRNKTFLVFSWESFRLRTGQPLLPRSNAKERIAIFPKYVSQVSLGHLQRPQTDAKAIRRHQSDYAPAGSVNAQGACPGSTPLPHHCKQHHSAGRIHFTVRETPESLARPNTPAHQPIISLQSQHRWRPRSGRLAIGPHLKNRQRLFLRFSTGTFWICHRSTGKRLCADRCSGTTAAHGRRIHARIHPTVIFWLT